jgi:signal transduction histidine kinase
VGVAIEALKDFQGINNPTLTNEYLGIAQNELNRLSLLADKILKTAIFENKGIEFKPEPIEMDKLIEQVLTSMKLVVEKQDAKVSFEKQGRDFSLSGGRVHLTSVVYNLVDNALKYSLINPEIIITLQEAGSKIVLSVKDNGIGIPAEYQKKVYEKFFRVPTGDVHNIKGYGLGLSYVESVVSSHKGTIELESKPALGSCFVITLPK